MKKFNNIDLEYYKASIKLKNNDILILKYANISLLVILITLSFLIIDYNGDKTLLLPIILLLMTRLFFNIKSIKKDKEKLNYYICCYDKAYKTNEPERYIREKRKEKIKKLFKQ